MGKDKVSYNSTCASIILCRIGRLLCWNNASIIGKFFESIPEPDEMATILDYLETSLFENISHAPIQLSFKYTPGLSLS